MRMIIKMFLGAVLVVVTALGWCVDATPDAHGFVRMGPDDAHWVDVPNGHGVKMAVIAGDPAKPGLYIVRVKFPPGIMSTPHHHPEDRFAVVLKGTWYTGTDDSWDPDRTVGLPPGSFMKHPAGAIHYDGAKNEEVIVQIAGMGPSGTILVDPDGAGFGPPHKLR